MTKPDTSERFKITNSCRLIYKSSLMCKSDEPSLLAAWRVTPIGEDQVASILLRICRVNPAEPVANRLLAVVRLDGDERSSRKQGTPG